MLNRNSQGEKSRLLKTFLTAIAVCSLLAIQQRTVLLAPQQSSQDEALTLARAVDIALRTNPISRIAAADSEMADAQLREARAGRLPVLQATETLTVSNNPVFVFGTLLEQGRFAAKNFDVRFLNHPDSLRNFRSAATLQIPVFDARQTGTRIAQAKIRKRQAEQQTNMVAQNLRYEVIRGYYGLLLSQEQVTVADDAVKTAEADVKSTRDRFEAGLVVQSDLLAAEVQLAEFRQQRIQALADVVTSRAALNTALGLPIETLLTPTEELTDRSFTVGSLELLSSGALENRPEYRRALLSKQAAAAQVRGARGEWLPRVSAFVTAGASSRYLVGGSGDYAVGTSLTFNVFDAGRKPRIDQARATESMATADAERLANQIRFEVVRAYQQHLSARERLAVVARISEQASETLRIVRDRYQVGLTTITELLRAETALVRARSSALAARYDQYVSFANLLLVTGNLKDVRQFGS